MSLQRFLIIASVVFLIGIGALYAGVNRVPFQHNVNHEKHDSLLPVAVALAGIASSDKVQLAVENAGRCYRDYASGQKELI